VGQPARRGERKTAQLSLQELAKERVPPEWKPSREHRVVWPGEERKRKTKEEELSHLIYRKGFYTGQEERCMQPAAKRGGRESALHQKIWNLVDPCGKKKRWFFLRWEREGGNVLLEHSSLGERKERGNGKKGLGFSFLCREKAIPIAYFHVADVKKGKKGGGEGRHFPHNLKGERREGGGMRCCVHSGTPKQLRRKKKNGEEGQDEIETNPEGKKQHLSHRACPEGGGKAP